MGTPAVPLHRAPTLDSACMNCALYCAVPLRRLSKPSAKQALDTDPCFAKNAQETESAADEYLPPPPTITHDIDTDSPPPKRPLSTRIKASLASIARDFNALGQSYAALSPGNRRNVCTYVVHLIVDTAGFFWTLWLLLQVWCLCGDVVMNAQVSGQVPNPCTVCMAVSNPP